MILPPSFVNLADWKKRKQAQELEAYRLKIQDVVKEIMDVFLKNELKIIDINNAMDLIRKKLEFNFQNKSIKEVENDLKTESNAVH